MPPASLRRARPLFLALALLPAAPAAPRAGVLEGVPDFLRRVAVQFHVLRLAALPPDSVLVMPVRTTRVGRISDTWHAPRGADRRHEGQDIFAPRGTPVHSATRGYVLRTGETRLGGLTVWIAGTGGRLYYYAHLDAVAEGIRVNRRVDPETVIGTVGSTGNARGTAPHLHFGVYTRTGAINPLPLLRDPPVSPRAAPPSRGPGPPFPSAAVYTRSAGFPADLRTRGTP